MSQPDQHVRHDPSDSQHSQHSRNAHSSASRWRHQESASYARHAAQTQPREPVTSGTTGELASFLNTTRVDGTGHDNAGHDGAGYKPLPVAAVEAQRENIQNGVASAETGRDPGGDGREIVCGPLLNYRHTQDGRWNGSVLIVVQGGGLDVHFEPTLNIRRAGDAADSRALNGNNGATNGAGTGAASVPGERLYSDKRNTFWVFDISVPIEEAESKYEYELPDMRYSTIEKPRVNHFFVHAAGESMRVMFHSCNGFSVGTDEDAFSGIPLWKDVLRKHEAKPFHVMLGGGDQIYNDGIRVHGPLRAWTEVGNPRKRREYAFPETLRSQCDDYYLQNYIRWYNTAPFAVANGQIPQVNIWDDHDIIDGFGSYTDHFMRCDVFRGIGGTAHKYYMLFQHHMAPPLSTYTSDHKLEGVVDPAQQVNTFVAEPKIGSQYILGAKPGPYVAERSFNIYTRLGARMAMLGLDARTERTRHQVNYPETYRLVFDRLRHELQAAASSGQPIQHLVILLGIPIAYPRLTWLENVLRSPVIGPIKFMSRRFGLGGGLFNHFDGSVDLLDDLDDHYTARTHKAERAMIIEELQKVSAEFSARVTILGGDVHLAALGRFYANPKLKVPVEEDNRYMANVISSAIVNKPPPQAVANLLARRNKIHHLNHETDETLLNLFNKDPGDSNKTANHNHCTMPSRNFATLTENSPNNVPRPQTDENGHAAVSNDPSSFFGRDGHEELHQGEVGAGTSHRAAADESHGLGNDGSLDIRINVEIDQHNAEGSTQGYGLTVPVLRYSSRKTPSSNHAAH